LKVDSRVTLCSSIGWAHGVRTTGRKLVYCHGPAKWLYQSERYMGNSGWVARAGLGALKPFLDPWDRRAAATADRYLVNSRAIQAQVASVYGIAAEVVAPPVSFLAAGPTTEVPGIPPGFVLCVSRLLPYKNVASIVESFALLPAKRLVVVGVGPLLGQLRAAAGPNVRLLGGVDEATLRWLYRSCAALVAASYEDFGLTPLEAAAHGKPSVVLRAGGFLDTVSEAETGIFFDDLDPANIARAVRAALATPWDEQVLVRRSELFSVERFVDKMRSIVAEELAFAG
jgi:glycosyltransferase involved in cell wall biosynthesis